MSINQNNMHGIDEPHEWWRGAVIYQIYPRSFLDTNADGIGDLKGITKKLGYVADLGVDAIWLSPFFKSPMADFGYDVADYCEVDPIFGTLEDFDDLIANAHRLGLKIIIDQVYSHTSDQHFWFQESRQNKTNSKADWYVWANPKPDGSPPNNWQSVFGGPAWEYDSRRQQYYLHNFLASQPDLNIHNPDVQTALLDVARFWLNRGVDGFRLDAINFAMHDPQLRDNPAATLKNKKLTRPFDYQLHLHNQSHTDIPKFLEKIRMVTNEFDAIFTVAEVAGPNPLAEMKAFTSEKKLLNSAYNFSFLYADKITNIIVKQAQTPWSTPIDEGWPSWAFSNHDAPRAISRWAFDADQERAAKFFALLLMSLRGNAFLYQGEELGLPQATIPFEALQDPEAITNWPDTLGRDGARSPMPWCSKGLQSGFTTGTPWLPIDERHSALAANTQESNPKSVLNFVRKVINIRQSFSALRIGDLTFIEPAGDVLAFQRNYQDQEILCVFNLTQALQNWQHPEHKEFQPLATVGVDSPDKFMPENIAPLSGYIAMKNKKI